MTAIARRGSSVLGPGTSVGPTWLRLSETLSFDDYLAVAKRLASFTNSSRWWIGDLLFHGQWEFGSKYAEAMQILPYDEQTLKNLNSLAGKFDIARRRPGLSVEHHAVIASLSTDVQEQLLDVAEAEKLSRSDFRELARPHLEQKGRDDRQASGATQKAAVEKLYQLSVRATEAERDRWLAAAAERDVHVSDWLRAVANEAAV